MTCLLAFAHELIDCSGDTLGLGLLSTQTPLDSAADAGHTEIVAALLKAGANPKAPGFMRGLGIFLSRTPLDSAFLKGHHAAADLLRDAPRVRTYTVVT